MSIVAHTVLRDRYQVVRRIGGGGMGTVYEAIDLTLRNTVAVKELIAGEHAQLAFEREARLLAALRFPALPVVIDYFIERGAPFLVMQYIEGEDLAERLERLRAPCSAKEVLRWSALILQALSYLHSQEPPIIHRDIKPANIKLTPRGEIVLLDFGIAKGRPQQATTDLRHEASIVAFTPGYAPPEQIEAQSTDASSDLYALAATMYHLVLGKAPAGAEARKAALDKGRPDPLDSSGFIRALGCDVTRALELDSTRRYESAQEMLAAITSDLDALLRETRPVKRGGVRRLDAAIPSQAPLDRPTDLIIQVRFGDSRRLGLEDWPTARKPARIEQVSEGIDVQHPLDPHTRRHLPAKLRIKIVAPDFEIFGRDEIICNVPPDDYSARLGFLLTPRRVGYCRINVEVFEATEPVYLGALALEIEALVDVTSGPTIRTSDLVLGVAAADPRIAEPTQAISRPSRNAAVEPPPQFSSPPALRFASPSVKPPETIAILSGHDAAGRMLGPYRILKKLGDHGRGQLYKALDTRFNVTVSIETTRAEPDSSERRYRIGEDEDTSWMRHPRILAVLDDGEGTLTTEQGSAQDVQFLVMEHLEGETLAQRLGRGRIPLGQALDCATQIADGLAWLHKHGKVFRALQPGNVMLVGGPPEVLNVKLLTDGMFRITDPEDVDLVRALHYIAHYMAPEQLIGMPTDLRMDLFAFGALVYEMVTGHRAFDGADVGSVFQAILKREPPPMTDWQPLAPLALDTLVRKCLAKSPADRWSSAREVVDELRSLT